VKNVALKLILAIVILAIPSVGGFSCGGSASPNKGLGNTWEEILELAREEGVVYIYTQLDTDHTIPLLDTAMKKYGIKVKNRPLYYREIMARVESEARANVHICDVISMNLGYMLIESNSVYYDDYGSLPSMDNPIVDGASTTWYLDPKHYPYGYVYTMGSPYGITCNTNNLEAAGIEFPTSWEDLANEDYYGKIVMSDPTRPGAGFAIVAAQLYYGPMGIDGTGVYDRAWLKGVLKNMYIARTMTLVPDELLEGRHTVYLPSRVRTPFNELENDPDAPIGWRYPDEGAYLAPLLLMPVKGAKHPNAAAVLLNYLFSEEGQLAIAAGLNIPNMAGLDTPEQYENAGSVWGTYTDAVYDITPLQPYPQDIDQVLEKEEAIGVIIDEIKEVACPPKTSPGKMLESGPSGKGAFSWAEKRICLSKSSTN